MLTLCHDTVYNGIVGKTEGYTMITNDVLFPWQWQLMYLFFPDKYNRGYSYNINNIDEVIDASEDYDYIISKLFKDKFINKVLNNLNDAEINDFARNCGDNENISMFEAAIGYMSSLDEDGFDNLIRLIHVCHYSISASMENLSSYGFDIMMPIIRKSFGYSRLDDIPLSSFDELMALYGIGDQPESAAEALMMFINFYHNSILADDAPMVVEMLDDVKDEQARWVLLYWLSKNLRMMKTVDAEILHNDYHDELISCVINSANSISTELGISGILPSSLHTMSSYYRTHNNVIETKYVQTIHDMTEIILHDFIACSCDINAYNHYTEQAYDNNPDVIAIRSMISKKLIPTIEPMSDKYAVQSHKELMDSIEEYLTHTRRPLDDTPLLLNMFTPDDFQRPFSFTRTMDFEFMAYHLEYGMKSGKSIEDMMRMADEIIDYHVYAHHDDFPYQAHRKEFDENLGSDVVRVFMKWILSDYKDVPFDFYVEASKVNGEKIYE